MVMYGLEGFGIGLFRTAGGWMNLVMYDCCPLLAIHML